MHLYRLSRKKDQSFYNHVDFGWGVKSIAHGIIITECGHAYRSLAFEGPYLAGYPDGRPGVEIVHFVRLWYYAHGPYLQTISDGLRPGESRADQGHGRENRNCTLP